MTEQEQGHRTLAEGRTPSVFVGVGSPRQMWDQAWCAELNQWALNMPRPEAILLFSAHWLHHPLQLGATEPVPLVYDYYNFPPPFYDVKYPAPPAPRLAERFRDLLGDKMDLEPTERGLDHGAFVGLLAQGSRPCIAGGVQ